MIELLLHGEKLFKGLIEICGSISDTKIHIVCTTAI